MVTKPKARRCNACHQVKGLSAFYTYKGNPKYICRDCDSALVNKRQFEKRLMTYNESELLKVLKKHKDKIAMIKAEIATR